MLTTTTTAATHSLYLSYPQARPTYPTHLSFSLHHPHNLPLHLHFFLSPTRHHHHHHHLHHHPTFSCKVTPSNTTTNNIEIESLLVGILQGYGATQLEAEEIAAHAPKYGEMLLDGVRELDEMDLWGVWLREKGVGVEEDEEGGEMTSLGLGLSFEEKVKLMVKYEKGDNGKVALLESVGLALPTASHLARVLDKHTLPSLILKVKNVKEMFFSGSDDERLVGKLARRMVVHLSIGVDEDVQQTLSFFEKVGAERGGLDMLGFSNISFRHLIQTFPRLLLLSVRSHINPVVDFLKNVGVEEQCLGNVLLLFPPMIFMSTDKIRKRLQIFQKVEKLENGLGRVLMIYPWVLSRGMREKYEELVEFFKYMRIPQVRIHQAIKDWPQLLGCSPDRFEPMLDQLDDLGLSSTELGKVISTSPQLLLKKPEEFQEVVSFHKDLGFDDEGISQVLVRCPEIFCLSIEKTLQRKVDFLTGLGLKRENLPRILKKYPEFFLYDVDETIMPRLEYLMSFGLSQRDIGWMVTSFSPIFGYSIEKVLRPKIEFLLNTMGKPVKTVVAYPRYFSYSLEKKIKPRFYMLKSKNIDCSLKDMLGKNDEEFVQDHL